MKRIFHRPAWVAGMTLALAPTLPVTAADDYVSPPEPVMAFLDRHCLECHDDSVAKADLNLLDLPFHPEDPANFKLWERALDRVRAGEMPPKDEPRPEDKAREKFLADLTQPLFDVDRADIEKNGRVLSRRLTRVEYEYSVHDLLGIDIPLAELLPEDRESHGFETVADGQQLSHHQLARYLDVADLALDEAFSRAIDGDHSYDVTIAPEELIKNRGGNYRGPDLRDGKSISWPIGLQFFGRMRPTKVPESGWYRVTLKQVEAINPGSDGAVWGTLRSGECESNAPLLFLLGLVEATKEPRDLVYEAWIQGGHQLELRPNDGELKKAPTGAKGGNVSFKDRDLASQGFSGIANRGIRIERIYPNANRAAVKRNLFGDDELETWKDKPAAGLDKMVARFARRAFRRPVTPEQLAPYREIGHAELKAGASLVDALRSSYRAVLCSPRFLTFVEKPGQLDDYAIASRLSYALWISLPDWKLTKAAAEGKLHEPKVLSEQIDRLLADPKSARFIDSFTDQWLKMKEIDFTGPDPRQFKTFDSVLQESLLRETRAYVTEMVKKDLSVASLVDSDFSFLNGRLARHYQLDELPLKPGAGLQKVSFAPDEKKIRGGLVTQGAVLKVTADGTHTSPVIRGKFINERILGVEIPPPPPGVPAIEPDIRGATSIRDQLEKHRNNETCASCHQTIDPPGFALENFDPIGGWRTKYGIGNKGAAVNPSGLTPDGAEFAGLRQWKAIYRDRKPQLAEGFASQFLTYATGAAPRFSDAAALEAIVKETEGTKYGVKSLIRAAITSPIFLTK
ncbi:MAG: DUF1592 domain-containing protein [Verrucomicrobiae bacterium]|nr:DUF1592 domain-containing protein [Verrucomicrobiae bacterium]